MEVYNNSITKNIDPTQTSDNPFEHLLDDLKPVGSYKDSTYEVVSIIAYLIGVPEDKICAYPQYAVFPKLNCDKNARIIRNLCIARTLIERNFKKINDAMQREYKSISNMPEYLPFNTIRQLNEDGANFIKKSSTKLTHHIIEINRLISDRINNCKPLFPDWVKWEYIRDLFIMPNGLTEAGTKAAADLYYPNQFFYPFQCYINWHPYEAGNILLDDRKFMTILYEQHNDYFADFNQTSDAGSLIKNRIYDFLEQAQKVVAFVDCENSDPYKLCAALKGLEPEELAKLSKIILFDDVHTTAAWAYLELYTHVPVEHMLIDRLHSGKSLVDGRLMTRACQEHYVNGVDSILLVSSDSDYWSLISSLESAEFLVMIEKEKCGPDLKEAMQESDIGYCYLDDFYAGGSEDLKNAVIMAELDRQLQEYSFNLKELLDKAVVHTRAAMTSTERERFIEKHLKRLEFVIDKDANVSISIRR